MAGNDRDFLRSERENRQGLTGLLFSVTPTLRQALREATVRLRPSSDSPELDAEILLAHVLEVSRAHLYAWPGQPLDPSGEAAYADLLRRRQAGEPVAYLTGRREFWSLELRVTPDTLIPRPETELLVEQALDCLPIRAATVLDAGTGSGALALALASEQPGWTVLAGDISLAALRVARDNARRLGLTNLRWLACDGLSALADGCLDLVLSNPPYLAADDPHLQAPALRYEPIQALVAGDNGLAILKQLIEAAPRVLVPGGWLLLEHGATQSEAVQIALRQQGFAQCFTRCDLAGLPRLSGGRRASRAGNGQVAKF